MRLALLAALVAAHLKAATPDAVLHGVAADKGPGWVVFQPSPLNAFHVSLGESAEARLAWTTEIPETDRYRVRLRARSSLPGARPVVTVAGQSLVAAETLPRDWDRLEMGSAQFSRGAASIQLAVPLPAGTKGRVEIQAVELIRERRASEEEARARLARADTDWMRRAGFGVMVHWTRESAPARGPRKPHAQAVADLDVSRLAAQLAETRAGFVVLTTSHVHQDFPAPIRALDVALPGRTTARDLPAELIRTLERRGLRMMLYHHPGSGSDPAWLRACGLAEGKLDRHFALWESIIAEAGERYGEGLAGWWFDDGATGFYLRQAPWERLHRAARKGNPARAVGFNAWEYPSVTPWQDFDCGEGLRDPRGREGRLAERDEGIYRSSSRAGQRATACVMLEDGWVHLDEGRMPSAPTWTEAELGAFLARSRRTGLVPILNLKVTQEGLLGPASVVLLRAASEAAR